MLVLWLQRSRKSENQNIGSTQLQAPQTAPEPKNPTPQQASTAARHPSAHARPAQPAPEGANGAKKNAVPRALHLNPKTRNWRADAKM